MSFEEVTSQIKLKYEEDTREITEQIKELQTALNHHKNIYDEKIKNVKKAKELGFSSMTEYEIFNSAEKDSPEYLEIEEKRKRVIFEKQLKEINKSKTIYNKAQKIIFENKNKKTQIFSEIVNEFTNNICNFQDTISKINLIVNEANEIHFFSLAKKAPRLYCSCGDSYEFSSGTCERGARHYIYPNRLPKNFLNWNIQDFMDEQPYTIN